MKGAHLFPHFLIHVEGPPFIVFGFTRVEPHDPLFQIYFVPGQPHYLAFPPALMTLGRQEAFAAVVGGFTAGAVSGGTTAAVYGGNIWQGALCGGLSGAAFAGLVQGAIELNNWANSTPTVAQGSRQNASMMVAGDRFFPFRCPGPPG